MIPPRADRRKSKTLTLTAWQAAFFTLLAMTVTLGAVAYAQIKIVNNKLEEIQKSCQR